MFSFSFPKTSRPIIIDKLGLRRFTRMLGTAHREKDERGAAIGVRAEGAKGAAAPPNFGQLIFFGQREKIWAKLVF